MRQAPLAFILSAALAASGCLSDSHIIPRQDLMAIAHSNPHTRGQQVRVVQGMLWEDEPTPAPYVQADSPVYVHTGFSGGANIHVGPPAPRSVPAKGSGGGSGGGSSLSGGSSGGDDAAWMVVVVAVAAFAAVGLAVTEGVRYDGWVGLHPMHPVHLYGVDGSQAWMPLAQVTPEIAARTRKAVVRPSEGPWQRMGRAPLNRRGLTYAFLIGSTEVPAGTSRDNRGFSSHIQLGVFPTQHIGIVGNLGLGWARNELGNTMSDLRSSVELQVLPVSAGRFHAGVFGQYGSGRRLDDGPMDMDAAGRLLGFGGIAQLELTTRLAITARAGVTHIYGSSFSDFTMGLSIY